MNVVSKLGGYNTCSVVRPYSLRHVKLKEPRNSKRTYIAAISAPINADPLAVRQLSPLLIEAAIPPKVSSILIWGAAADILSNLNDSTPPQSLVETGTDKDGSRV